MTQNAMISSVDVPVDDEVYGGLRDEGARDGAPRLMGIPDIWISLGRSGQAMILGAALFATLMVMFATATEAYGGTCAGTSVAAADIARLTPPVA